MDFLKNKFTLFGLIVFTISILIIVITLFSSNNNNSANNDEYASSGGILLGDPNAPVTIVKFTDYQCPSCASFTLGPGKQIFQEYVDTGKANFIYRNYPFIGDESFQAAEAALCASDQDRLKDYDEIIYVNWNGQNKGTYSEKNLITMAELLQLNVNSFSECMSSDKHIKNIQKDIDDGKKLGIKSTPSVLIDGELILGTKSYGDYRVIIERALGN